MSESRKALAHWYSLEYGFVLQGGTLLIWVENVHWVSKKSKSFEKLLENILKYKLD